MCEISKRLAREAERLGVCEEWKVNLLNTEDKAEMVKMYISGIDFCFKHDYPSREFIRENFVGVMEKEGVFLDEKIELYNPKTCVLLGSTDCELHAHGYNVTRVYARHEAKIDLTADDNAFVMIDLHDKASLNIKAMGEASVVVHLHDEATCNVEARIQAARIKITDKNKDTTWVK